jgi:hypothetical protein
MLTESELRALPIGARVVLPKGADAYPDFLIAERLFGAVDRHDGESVWVKIDKPFAELAEWNNCVQCWYWDDAPSHDIVPLWRHEFPDFTAAELPAIPAEWRDVSWHNDTCPSWETPSMAYVFIDYADDARREMPGGARYSVMSDGDVILSTDDFDSVLATVRADAETAIPTDGDTFNAFVREYCQRHAIRCDGDVFGLMFSGHEVCSKSDAMPIIEEGARIYGL